LQDRLSAAGLDSWNSIILGAILAVLVVIAREGLYTHVRARPWPVLATFVAVTGVLAVVQVWGELLDWLLAGLLAAAVVGIAWSRVRPMRPAVPAPPPVVETAPAAVEPEPEPAKAPATLVTCHDVRRYFGGVRALDGVSLDIREAEIVGLIGPNGSGKTTLVNLLCGAMRPTAGTIHIGGRSVAEMPAHRVAHAGVARTYQVPRPFGSMTVRDNVATAIMFGRAPVPLPVARRSAEEHLETVRLGHLAGARPTALNLHQRQLLEIARAIASKPTVLLLDEALAGLNPVEIDDAVAVIRRIHASGIAIVVVEHLLRVLHGLATRLVVLDRGLCIADGEPKAVLSDPAVVRAYLGTQHARG
jgi:branched-chain amino acid transport system permease protein